MSEPTAPTEKTTMNTLVHDDPSSESYSEDALLRLEFAVAHRADELWRNEGQGRGSDLDFWMRAEREVMGNRSGLPQGGGDRHAGGPDRRE